MRVCVVGLGYIGLPTAAMLASRGHDVVGYDIREEVVVAINAGQAHFYEPDLQMLLTAAVGTGKLRAAVAPEPADYFLIAVPTPVRPGGAPDMSYVEAASSSIAPALSPGSTVILESTSPVGSTEAMAAALAAARPDLSFPRRGEDDPQCDIAVCYCPERILPGQMVRELVANDRILGGITRACAERAKDLYETFVMGACHITDARTAELVKLSENAFRDVNIAFANELSMICERFDTDVWQVREFANRHPRVSILEPGAGVGGHCIAVDPWFLISSAPEDSRLMRAARTVNDDKPDHVVARVEKLAKGGPSTIACFGITYKPDVDDLRESPALEIARRLAALDGNTLLVCEPNCVVLPEALRALPNVRKAQPLEAIERAEIVVLLVAHREFKALDPALMRGKKVVDAVGLLRRRLLVWR